MSRIEWTEDELDELAARLAPRLTELAAALAENLQVGWLDSHGAAAYLGISVTALHKYTAARTIPFEQDVAGGKLWFKAEELDAWRRGGKA